MLGPGKPHASPVAQHPGYLHLGIGAATIRETRSQDFTLRGGGQARGKDEVKPSSMGEGV